MKQQVTFSESDEGKKVVNSEGKTVGRVVDVRHGSAYVDPDPSMFDTIKAKLGWGDMDEDSYPLQKADVATVTDDEVRLRKL